MTLPIIDIERWRTGSDAARTQLAAEVDEALCTYGFLLVANHGVPGPLAAGIRSAAQEFFGMPAEHKERYRTRVGGRGWIPPGAETNSYASGVAAPPDIKETFKVGHQGHGSSANVWPDEVPSLRTCTEEYLQAIWALALDLFDIFGAALGLADGLLTDVASEAASSFNVNWYPSYEAVGPPAPGQFRIGPHSDFGVLTILDRQLGHGGLQIEAPDGRWIDAPYVPGTLTINIGDLLAHWTGDRWRSTVHRVLPPSDLDPAEELISLVAACGIDPDTVVETLQADAPQTYEPVRAGDYMHAKLAAIDTA